ncbi:DUF4333 domain-containing protein [Nocardia sp. 004]|uniref:DUF4333 domain-containing protein n=1 Tax=Nocardia sp. 004 TaxID=3385978 RepID=UPI0039A3E025
MSGPYGPKDLGEGRNDPTQQWGAPQPAEGPGAAQQWGAPQPQGGPAAAQQWGGQPQQPAPPPQQWGEQPQQQQQWGQPPAQGQQQWGGQPQQPASTPPPQQWGEQPQQQQQWGQPPAQGQQQWGQQQGWGGQPPQQQWGQQPQWGAPTAQLQPQGGKSKGLVIGLSVFGVAVIGAIVALVLMLTATDELDQAAVQDGVQKVLSDSYGIQDVSDVSCPAGQQVTIDATFECTVKVGGEDKKVSIKITKEDGTYEVGRPS